VLAAVGLTGVIAAQPAQARLSALATSRGRV
jgi:hypothetical protein